jgi:hypothetical protein
LRMIPLFHLIGSLDENLVYDIEPKTLSQQGFSVSKASQRESRTLPIKSEATARAD